MNIEPERIASQLTPEDQRQTVYDLETIARWMVEARADERRNTAARIASRFGALADRAGEVGHYERAAFYSDAERIARDEAEGGQ